VTRAAASASSARSAIIRVNGVAVAVTSTLARVLTWHVKATAWLHHHASTTPAVKAFIATVRLAAASLPVDALVLVHVIVVYLFLRHRLRHVTAAAKWVGRRRARL
jgi:hypothetical protein